MSPKSEKNMKEKCENAKRFAYGQSLCVWFVYPYVVAANSMVLLGKKIVYAHINSPLSQLVRSLLKAALTDICVECHVFMLAKHLISVIGVGVCVCV